MNELWSFIFRLSMVWIEELITGIFHLIFFWVKSPKNVKGQLALVTGGARGLGKSIASRLAKEGCNIAICDINIKEAQITSDEIKRKFKVSCEAFKVDVSDTEHVNRLQNEIEEKMGTVDILVNNAGILAPFGVLEGDDSDVRRVLNINLTSHFWMVRKFLPPMIKQKRGHILGICSAGGKGTIPFAASYCASKYGVSGFYGSLYDDISMYEYDNFINVTCVCPGFINTRNDLENLLDESFKVVPRVEPDYAAEKIVEAVLYNKKEIIFPFAYKFLPFAEYLIPPKTLKFLKREASKIGPECEEKRLKIARV